MVVLTTLLTFGYLNTDKKFILVTDANKTGIDGVLSQI